MYFWSCILTIMKSKLYTMRMRLIVFCLLAMGTIAQAQMDVNGKMLFGNEWIDYDRTYWKAYVAEDGMYKMTVAELKSAGIPVESTPLSRLEVNYFGETLPVFTSTDGIGSDDDYILFYGQKNRGQLDEYMKGPEETLLNPEYSLINDTSAYFLSISPGDVANRITEKRANLTGNTLTPEPYYLHTEEKVFSNFYYKPTINSQDVRYSWVVNSEGYGSELQANNSFELEANNIYSAGPSALLEIQYGGNNTAHLTKTFLNGTEIDSNLISESFNQVINLKEDISITEIKRKNKIELKGILTSVDKNIVGYGKLTYAHTFDMDNKSYVELDLVGSSTPRYLEISNWGGSDLTIYDGSSKAIYKPINEGGLWKIILPPSNGVGSKGVIFFSEGTNALLDNEPKKFIDYTKVDHDFVFLTSRDLRDDGQGNDYVQEYADYRGSDAGGGYNPVVVNVDELYDQYGYGVKRHVMGIRNFNQYVKSQWTDYKFLFIVGHGLEYDLVRSPSKLAQHKTLMQVPTFGKPGSDILLSDDNNYNPIVAVGRIAVESATGVESYFSKAKEFDESRSGFQSIEDKLWIKDIVHLSGGDARNGLQDLIARNLSVIEDTIVNSSVGADVHTFYKKTSSTIEEALSQQIFNVINNGTSIITFFGHSHYGAFDFNLDRVDNYDNQGKYPLLISLGCYSGNIFTTTPVSVAKDFVFAENKGSIAFLGSVGTSYANQHFSFSKEFYSLLGKQRVDRTIGTIKKEIQNKYGKGSPQYYQQLNLHGDPSLVLFSADEPDIILDKNKTLVKPAVVDIYSKSFELCFSINNLGAAVDDVFDVAIRQEGPSGAIINDTLLTLNVPIYEGEYCLDLPMLVSNPIGENKIFIDINPSNNLNEGPLPLASENNDDNTGFSFYVLGNSAVPVYPHEYGIVNKKNIELKASTYNFLGEMQDFIIQIDTTNSFNSSLLQEHKIKNKNGLISQAVQLLEKEEVVYYWRISIDESRKAWRGSSFVYASQENEGGWNQSHYQQYTDDSLARLEVVEGSLKFGKISRDMQLVLNDAEGSTNMSINASRWDNWQKNISKGVAVSVIDRVNGQVWQNFHGTGGLYGSVNRNRRQSGWTHYFEYPADSETSTEALLNLLQNVIPDGDYVIIHFLSKNNDEMYPIEFWDTDRRLFEELENQGAKKLNDISRDQYQPFVFAYVKGSDENVLVEQTGSIGSNDINTVFPFSYSGTSGQLWSTNIGPADKYENLTWDVLEESSDQTSISVYGIDQAGNQVLLLDSLQGKDISLKDVNASLYPFLKLKISFSDSENFTIPKLNKVRVNYSPYVDLAIESLSELKDFYQQGEDISLSFNVLNLGTKEVDKTDLFLELYNNSILVDTEKVVLGGLDRGSNSVTANISTKKGIDTLSFRVIVNPSENPKEITYFNNVGLSQVVVKPDTIDPVVTLTFDGRTIFNDEIVSSNPLILIEIDDENEFLEINNFNDFTIEVIYPDGTEKVLKESDPDVIFVAAEKGSKNIARVEYNPEFELEGDYQIKVFATDRTSNIAGNAVVESQFRVIKKESISNVFNYPNPFSDNTQFIFTLTGQLPENLSINIMTVSGKVVRQITAEELGPIHVGLNRTQFKWDGRDDYGQKLGNGVYIYSVNTSNGKGEQYELFSDDSIDGFFKKNFGKMVIMR